MSIIHIASASALREALTRKCPKCHYKQLVAMADQKKNVTCKKCGATLPHK